MRVLVYPHDLAIGGSQLNAIEIAAAVQELGHSCTVVGRPGALIERVRELGLEFVELPAPSRRPSRRVVKSLVRLIDERQIDVVHGYEWPPTLEALWAARLRPQVAVTSTVMSMAVAPFIPKSVPLLVGTAEIAAAELRFGRQHVGLLEPPVDLEHNDAMPRTSGQHFRGAWGIGASEILVVAVTRLAHQLKLEGLLTAMKAVAQLREEFGVRLMIVGDGPARAEVEVMAGCVNEIHGANSVILTGELADPRPAYASADIALGMGGSALRAMAFSKPLIVQGELGFWRLLTAESAEEFLWAGWYGRGTEPEGGTATLQSILRPLLRDPAIRSELGTFGRQLVEDRFNLARAAQTQIDFYSLATSSVSGRRERLSQDLAGSGRYVRYYIGKRARRALGKQQSDDFNVRPVSGSKPRSRRQLSLR